jgi:GNAT superfamily N-acetyltransferase
LPDVYRKVTINTQLSIIWNYAHRSGSGADFTVKAVKPYKNTTKERTLYGIAKLTVNGGNKEVTLHDFIVYPQYRRRGFGSKMLKFIVDYLTNGTTEIIMGDIRGIDDQEVSRKFYLKNGFAIQDYKLSIELDKPKYPQFHYDKLEAIFEKEYRSF